MSEEFAHRAPYHEVDVPVSNIYDYWTCLVDEHVRFKNLW